jgi:hypothetical protein
METVTQTIDSWTIPYDIDWVVLMDWPDCHFSNDFKGIDGGDMPDNRGGGISTPSFDVFRYDF